MLHLDEQLVCFLDIHPINPGHLLICPRAHLRDLTDLPHALRGAAFSLASTMAARLQQRLGCDGVSLLQNSGDFNDLGHFHLHVFPRFKSDGFGWIGNSHGAVAAADLSRMRAGLADCPDGAA